MSTDMSQVKKEPPILNQHGFIDLFSLQWLHLVKYDMIFDINNFAMSNFKGRPMYSLQNTESGYRINVNKGL